MLMRLFGKIALGMVLSVAGITILVLGISYLASALSHGLAHWLGYGWAALLTGLLLLAPFIAGFIWLLGRAHKRRLEEERVDGFPDQWRLVSELARGRPFAAAGAAVLLSVAGMAAKRHFSRRRR